MIEESTIDRQRFGFGQTHIHQSPIDIIDNGFANPQQAGRRICDIPIYQRAIFKVEPGDLPRSCSDGTLTKIGNRAWLWEFIR